MPENHHAAYAAARAQQQERRAAARAQNTKALVDAGIAFTVFDGGAHLRIEHAGQVIDFMAGPGTWSLLGDRRKRYGVRTLINYIAKGHENG